MMNLYWPIYKRLEQEVVDLSDFIYIDDSQLSVYSIKLAELLIRCSMEIEAISKELYYKYVQKPKNKKFLSFDSDCIDFLESIWKLESKKVIILHPNFYLTDENRSIFPLRNANKRGVDGSEWKQAYQAVKHNRTRNIQMANIKNLLAAMGALFILNIYHMNRKFSVSTGIDANFLLPLSKLFNICVYPDEMYGEITRQNFWECTYFITLDEEYEYNRENWNSIYMGQLHKLVYNNPKVKKYLSKNFGAPKDGIPSQATVSLFAGEKAKEIIGKEKLIELSAQARAIATKQANFNINSSPKYTARLNMRHPENQLGRGHINSGKR